MIGHNKTSGNKALTDLHFLLRNAFYSRPVLQSSYPFQSNLDLSCNVQAVIGAAASRKIRRRVFIQFLLMKNNLPWKRLQYLYDIMFHFGDRPLSTFANWAPPGYCGLSFFTKLATPVPYRSLFPHLWLTPAPYRWHQLKVRTLTDFFQPRY